MNIDEIQYIEHYCAYRKTDSKTIGYKTVSHHKRREITSQQDLETITQATQAQTHQEALYKVPRNPDCVSCATTRISSIIFQRPITDTLQQQKGN